MTDDVKLHELLGQLERMEEGFDEAWRNEEDPQRREVIKRLHADVKTLLDNWRNRL